MSPVVWQELADVRMEEKYFGECYVQRKASLWVKWFEAHNNRRILGRLASLPLSGARLLEIGVGSGSFLAAARAAGYDVMGCDLSPAICRMVEYNHGVTIFIAAPSRDC